MARQLNLDRDKLDGCYQVSGQIVSFASKYIDRHSSPSVERATLMLLGIEGDYRGKHLASWLVESLTKDQLRLGASYWWGRALLSPLGAREDPKNLAEKLGRGKIKWSDIPDAPS
ncbi:MAG: lysine 5,6-aminomutase subunit alpha, partial [Deltaproteobacteria bacterium]|nr:lysine 5,6-aminomutase subunit alpha [Deltaproteobacteria bacterium]